LPEKTGGDVNLNQPTSGQASGTLWQNFEFKKKK